ETGAAAGGGRDHASGVVAAAGEPGAPDRDEVAAQASAAREIETGARLEVRTAEERLRAIAGRADALAAAAVAERRATLAAAERNQRRQEQAQVASAVVQGTRLALDALARSLAVATAGRQAAEQAREGRSDALKSVRTQVRELAGDLDRVVDSAHGAEMVQAERRIRLEQVASRAAEEFGVDTESLVAEYGPDVLIPPPADEADGTAGRRPAAREPATGEPAHGEPTGGRAAHDEPSRGETAHGPLAAGNGLASGGPATSPAGNGLASGGSATSPAGDAAARPSAEGGRPFVREEQERRAAVAQRQLDQLGKVNPLALEEYAALEERHAFLAAQLEDLKKTRRDLLTVVKEVDDRVQEVFAAAFEDTAREFEDIFGRLFPGGQGRLILTEPDDMLATGIDFEARPPGKKVRRLSLLSGGERSLTAIAFLVAIFKARPSPFYVLDEVEAALDDTNLQRLLHIFEELRATSQLLLVTHQKRTMEVADALYGISMQGDGVSSVVSQRLREPERT
ncbi:MAG TPA: AAA family ATPase, partial [Streptosporangiaceae bacterium]